jgi:hypothetical protein
MPQDLLHHPALAPGERPGFNDPDLVADLAAKFVVGHDTFGRVDHFFVQLVAVGPGDLHHDTLFHLITGDNTSHATAVIHFTPSDFSAIVRSCNIVIIRAISRRT